VTPLVEAVIFFSGLKHVGSVAVATESTSVFSFFLGFNGGVLFFHYNKKEIYNSDRHERENTGTTYHPQHTERNRRGREGAKTSRHTRTEGHTDPHDGEP
jgi:hypothetical protein